MATDTTTDEVATWRVITGSARGAAHRASGLPNQDAAASHDRHWFEQEVPGWARRCASAEGSGDDATIALLLPGDARDAEEDG
jgi:hypothetical protein